LEVGSRVTGQTGCPHSVDRAVVARFRTASRALHHSELDASAGGMGRIRNHRRGDERLFALLLAEPPTSDKWKSRAARRVWACHRTAPNPADSLRRQATLNRDERIVAASAALSLIDQPRAVLPHVRREPVGTSPESSRVGDARVDRLAVLKTRR